MGYNRSGKRRTQRMKRNKRETARLLRKQAGTQTTTTSQSTAKAAT